MHTYESIGMAYTLFTTIILLSFIIIRIIIIFINNQITPLHCRIVYCVVTISKVYDTVPHARKGNYTCNALLCRMVYGVA
jgi:hypothetical protein